ncbi:tail fiber assembly protein [Yersinia bercovieri]|uniref:tail fiber assembly protein n=1 Tax=Yersinia bercovieri TaxID=634 RepID=UPI0011A528E2|nr:tail fiber assembly protein [Yersinia bercovieri]
MTIQFDKDGYAVTSGTVAVYNFMPDTREYIGSSSEFISRGQGLPAYSHIDEPLKAKKGFAVCRTQDNRSWEYVADHRGETRYSTVTRAEALIKELGEYPESTTDIAPAQFDMWNGSAWVVDEAAKSAAAIQSAKLKKAELKALADSEIEWRQDAVDDKSASEKEIADLAAWLKYRVALMRIDTSKAPDIGWPIAPE